MNPILFIVLAAALIGVAFYLVALPLLQHARRATAPATDAGTERERLGELLAQRDAAFQALRELNFDHRVGKLSDDDFAAFEVNLKRHAANTLRALDEWEMESDDDLDLTMEKEIQARRALLASPSSNGHDHGAAPCPTCAEPVGASDRFCSGCGADLTAVPRPPVAAIAENACPACGHPFQSGDRFCGSCGQPLAVAPAQPAR